MFYLDENLYSFRNILKVQLHIDVICLNVAWGLNIEFSDKVLTSFDHRLFNFVILLYGWFILASGCGAQVFFGI